MAWNSPVTWVDDTTPAAADLNAQIRDNLLYLKGDAGPISLEDAIELPEMATPASPTSGLARIYPKSDGLFYSIDDGGQEYPLGRFRARVYNTASISLANGAGTALTFDTERFDVGGFHSTSVNTGRLTIPVAGTYLVGANVQYAANATGVRQGYIRLNGTTVLVANLVPAVTGGVVTEQVLVTMYNFAANDYVELVAFQNSGGALNLVAVGNYSPEFWIMGPL
jgi:hypothetical protein